MMKVTIQRFYFICQTCQQSIKTDSKHSAKVWLVNHVSDNRSHDILLTDLHNRGDAVSINVDAKT